MELDFEKIENFLQKEKRIYGKIDWNLTYAGVTHTKVRVTPAELDYTMLFERLTNKL